MINGCCKLLTRNGGFILQKKDIRAKHAKAYIHVQFRLQNLKYNITNAI